jgi:16S rRNA (cytidine1402-2'-O)-methyltransferase
MSGILYFVATPIGNLGDISFRAVETLQKVDIIFCEDTRRSAVLLNRYKIKKPLISYHKFNETVCAEKIIDMLTQEKNIALISDAGTPCISDPGEGLIAALRARNLKYTVIPGANAALSALVLSGFSMREFCFLGFLPSAKKDRQRLLEGFKNVSATLIFYVPPHDLKDDLSFLYKTLGARKCALVREITKIYEEVKYITLGDALETEARGEYCVVTEGAPPQNNRLNELSVEEHINYYIGLGAQKKDAVKMTARDRGVEKNAVYKATIK